MAAPRPGTTPTGSSVRVAAALPVVFGAASVGLLVAMTKGRVVSVLRDTGASGWLVLLTGALASATVAWLTFAAGRGKRVPVAATIAGACSPWLVGVAGMSFGFHRAEAAVSGGSVDPGQRAAILAMGLSEASGARVLGTTVTAALLTAVALGFAVAGLGQGAPRRTRAGVAVGLLAAIPLVSVAAYGASGYLGPVASIVLLLPAAAALAALPMAGVGTGPDAPEARSVALAAGSGLAAGIGVVAAAAAATTNGARVAMGALASVDPRARAGIAVEAAEEMARAFAVERYGAAFALLAAAVLGAWGAWVLRPPKENAGGVVPDDPYRTPAPISNGAPVPPRLTMAHVGGALAALAVVAGTLGADRWATARTTAGLVRVLAPPWETFAGFTPLAFKASAFDGRLDAIVGAETVVVASADDIGARLDTRSTMPSSALSTPDGRDKLMAAVTAVLATRLLSADPSPANALDPFDPYHEAARRGVGARDRVEPWQQGGMSATFKGRDSGHGNWLVPEPAFAVALDARTPPPVVRAILDAAIAAGARSILVVGLDAELPPTRSGAATDVPWFVAMGHAAPVATRLFLERALPAGSAERDPLLWHATIGERAPAQVERRSGSGAAFALTGEEPASLQGPSPGIHPQPVAYLALAEGVSLPAVVDTVTRARTRGFVPVLVGGGIPGHPEAPAPPAALARLEALELGWSGRSGGDASGPSRNTGDLWGQAETAGDLGRFAVPGHGTPSDDGGAPDGGLTRSATIRPGTLAVDGQGHLPPEVIQRIVRRNFGRLRACYERGLKSNPKLTGRVTVRFVIGRDGAVAMAQDSGSDLADQAVVRCFVTSLRELSFPQPEGGVVTVTYPMELSPGG